MIFASAIDLCEVSTWLFIRTRAKICKRERKVHKRVAPLRDASSTNTRTNLRIRKRKQNEHHGEENHVIEKLRAEEARARYLGEAVT